MSSLWRWQARAIAAKELRVEARSREGLLASGLFSALALAAVSFSSFIARPDPSLAGGMLAVVILFGVATSAPRLYLQEADQGTRDLLRLAARPSAVYAGKLLFACAQASLTALISAPIFAELVQTPVVRWAEYLAAAWLLALGSAVCLCLCGRLASEAKGRWIVAAATGLPLGLPLVFLGVRAASFGLGWGQESRAWGSLLGLLCYAGALAWGGIWLSGQAEIPDDVNSERVSSKERP